jgi:hypothetical protein
MSACCLEKRTKVRPTIQEQAAGFIMAGNALEQGQRIADTITRSGSELARIQQRVDGDDLLQQARHDAKGMPNDQGQLRYLFSLLAKLHQSALSPARVHQFGNPLQHLPIVLADALLHAWAYTFRPTVQECADTAGGRIARAAGTSVCRAVTLVRYYAIVVLLLRCSGSGRGKWRLSMLLYMIETLMLIVRPGRRLLIRLPVLMLMREDVRSL